MCHVTRDMWHVTRDMRHVTCDMWHMTRNLFGGMNILCKFQLPNSYRLWFMVLWRSGGKGSLSEWMNQWINHKAVYKTAPATPGLLIKHFGTQKMWGFITMQFLLPFLLHFCVYFLHINSHIFYRCSFIPTNLTGLRQSVRRYQEVFRIPRSFSWVPRLNFS